MARCHASICMYHNHRKKASAKRVQSEVIVACLWRDTLRFAYVYRVFRHGSRSQSPLRSRSQVQCRLSGTLAAAARSRRQTHPGWADGAAVAKLSSRCAAAWPRRCCVVLQKREVDSIRLRCVGIDHSGTGGLFLYGSHPEKNANGSHLGEIAKRVPSQGIAANLPRWEVRLAASLGRDPAAF